MKKTLIPTCNIMGVNIAAINMPWLIDFTKKYIKELSGDYLCVSNVHTTVMSPFLHEVYVLLHNHPPGMQDGIHILLSHMAVDVLLTM